MDEFAQTRGVDDLFDDDIVPIAAQAEELFVEEEPYEQHPQYAPEPPTPSPQPAIAPSDTSAPQVLPANRTGQDDSGAAQHRRRGNGRGRAGFVDRGGRGRGRGFGRGGKGVETPGNVASPQLSQTGAPATSDEPAKTEQENVENDNKTPPANSDEKDASPEGNDKSKEPKVYAVRGDRSGTGGVRKPKLTEDELSDRMAAAKLNAAKRAAAHARAEADEASFLERERVAQQKQRQEQANRRVMIGERERNRQRKLQAQTGREWDAEKTQESLSDRGRGSGYRRGMHGAVVSDVSRTPEDSVPEENWETGRGGNRGRGRGARGGRGRGRGGGGARRDENEPAPQSAGAALSTASFNPEADFPALPNGNAPEKPSVSVPLPSLDAASPLTPVGTWADQMEPPPPAKPAEVVATDDQAGGS